MAKRVIRRTVLTVLTLSIVAGCGRQVSQKPPLPPLLPDLQATGPATKPVPRPWVSAALDKTGGMPTWTGCTKLDFAAVVTAYRRDGSFYLTEHDFAVCPWSDAIRVTAREPAAKFVWQVVGAQYHTAGGDQRLDVSPVSAFYRDYAEVVYHIVTAPVRLLERNAVFTRQPAAVQTGGQWYEPIEAKFRGEEIVTKEKKREKIVVIEPYWTQGIYFQNRDSLLVDLIWLANPAAQRFLLVRGYDYASIKKEGVLIPTKIEIFKSGPDALPGERLAVIDLKQ